MNPTHSLTFVAWTAVLALCSQPLLAQGPKPPAAPPAGPPVAVATTNKLLFDADEAMTKKEWGTAATKLEEYIKIKGGDTAAKPNPDLEIIYFNIAFNHLMGEQYSDAETAFSRCAAKYPKNEYSSRCQLGIGRSCMKQDGDEKKNKAIAALRLAMKDPKLTAEAALSLGQVYIDLDKNKEALDIFRRLTGSDVRTPRQTTAAVEVIGLLVKTAKDGNFEDLILYLDRLNNQTGIRDAIAWYVTQVIIRGDEAVSDKDYTTALAVYNSVPPRSQIIDTQRAALDLQTKLLKALKDRVAADQKAAAANVAAVRPSGASEQIATLEPAIEATKAALENLEKKEDLDASLLLRRGRCLYYLDRYEEARMCFRAIRTQFPSATDAQHACYAEVIMLSKLEEISELSELCANYLRVYPDADNAEQVATLEANLLVRNRKWVQVGECYQRLEAKFPKSPNMAEFIYYQGFSAFKNGDEESDLEAAAQFFHKIIKTYPDCQFVEPSYYYIAMADFLGNKYKPALASTQAYLDKFPEGYYAGDMLYRQLFIEYNDKEDQTTKIIRKIGEFTATHPDDPSVGAMLSLLGDTYKKRNAGKTSDNKPIPPEEQKRNEDAAIVAYKSALEKAIAAGAPDDVIQYSLENATGLLISHKEWQAIADLHRDFVKRAPNNALVIPSHRRFADMFRRLGKGPEGAKILADALKPTMGDPANEYVESILDIVVSSIAPRKRPKDPKEREELQKATEAQLDTMLSEMIGPEASPIANARRHYALAQLCRAMKRNDLADLHIGHMGKDPTVLSPTLLSCCGNSLLKSGNLDAAEAMFKALTNRHIDWMAVGQVGLGRVALARKQYAEALKIFEKVLKDNDGGPDIREAKLGKLEALVGLDRAEEAAKLAEAMLGDRSLRGEVVPKIYLLWAQAYRKLSAKADAEKAVVLLQKAYATYQRVDVAYKGFPELSAEAQQGAEEVKQAIKLLNPTAAPAPAPAGGQNNGRGVDR